MMRRIARSRRSWSSRRKSSDVTAAEERQFVELAWPADRSREEGGDDGRDQAGGATGVAARTTVARPDVGQAEGDLSRREGGRSGSAGSSGREIAPHGDRRSDC